MPYKKDLWCGYCGTQDFKEVPDSEHPDDSRYSCWECTTCGAEFEDNSGYGYFTVDWGRNSEGTIGTYCLNSGELLHDTKLPRTPEGIVRHCWSKEDLRGYLLRTQIK